VADFCLFLKELLQDQNGKLRKDGENSDAYGNWNLETIASGLHDCGFQMDALPASRQVVIGRVATNLISWLFLS
jgi:hypothetical protein